mgnify:CR=1 FL=1
MNIADNLYVAFDYRLTLDSGEEVDRSPDNQPFGFITGAGQIVPGLEKGMMGMKVGDRSKITVAPEDAYGQVNPSLIGDVPRSHFPPGMELKPDMMFQSQGPDGDISARIIEVKDKDTVVVDLNHPLAGKTLHFNINIVEVRKPTSEEISGLFSCSGCGGAEDSDCGSCSGCS